jgi:hypothetical protein
MAFSEATRAEAKRLAGGRCQCEMSVCGHRGKCGDPLGNNWHAHHRTSVAAGGSDALSNCQPMCIPCHERTRTYGR